jgi:hypothetical protein
LSAFASVPAPYPDEPPPSLTRRLREVIGEEMADSRDLQEASDVHLEAAERLLARLLDKGCAARDTAVDLLTVDALVTYAFESAADQPGSVADLARSAMVRLASLGGSD